MLETLKCAPKELPSRSGRFSMNRRFFYGDQSAQSPLPHFVRRVRNAYSGSGGLNAATRQPVHSSLPGLSIGYGARDARSQDRPRSRLPLEREVVSGSYDFPKKRFGRSFRIRRPPPIPSWVQNSWYSGTPSYLSDFEQHVEPKGCEGLPSRRRGT